MDEVLHTALSMCEMGFSMQWCAPKAKRPIEPEWTTRPNKTMKELEATYRPGFNLGFRPGKFSVVDGQEVCVFDVDVKGGARFQAEAVAAAQNVVDFVPPTVISGSGLGQHYYVRFRVGTSPNCARTVLRASDLHVDGEKRIVKPGSKTTPAWFLELLSTGQNVIVPPSTHPDTLDFYKWVQP